MSLFGSKSVPLHKEQSYRSAEHLVRIVDTSNPDCPGHPYPLFRSKSVPLHRSLIVLWNTLSVSYITTQIELGIGMPLFGSKFVPLHRSLIVLWNTSVRFCTSNPDCTGHRHLLRSKYHFTAVLWFCGTPCRSSTYTQIVLGLCVSLFRIHAEQLRNHHFRMR